MTQPTTEIQTVSVATAAAELSTTPLHILMHIKRGLLRASEGVDGWQIEADSLVTLLAQRAAGAAPLTCQSSCAHAGSCSSSCG